MPKVREGRAERPYSQGPLGCAIAFGDSTHGSSVAVGCLPVDPQTDRTEKDGSCPQDGQPHDRPRDFRRRALAPVDRQSSPVRWFVLYTEANVEVDITALDAGDELRRELTHRGIVVALARVKQDVMDDLEVYGLADSVGSDRIFPTLPTAGAAYREWGRAQ
jgi:hypothetical protein